jgi:hypothetical protein
MRSRSAWLAVLLLWPILGQADDADVPELGVHLTALPPEASRPVVSAQLGGAELATQAGVAQLRIYREELPVAAGSDIADPRYRATLDGKFRMLESRTQGAPTTLAGHSAWTVVDVHPLSSGSTRYTCLTYVIADEHLYRLIVTAESSLGRPADFDALVVAMSGVKFEPVRAAAPAPATTG